MKIYHITLFPGIFFPENVACFLPLLHIQVHSRLDFSMEANTMNPDQTAPLESDLGPYCLQYRLPKNISRRESRRESRQ